MPLSRQTGRWRSQWGPDIAYQYEPVQTDRGPLVLTRLRVPELVLTSGNIIVRDALMGNIVPLKRSVKPGVYPVILSTITLPDETEPRPVAITLEFRPAPPTRWEPAIRKSRLAWLHPSIRKHQVAIDSWHLGILDVDAAVAWEAFVKTMPQDRSPAG